MRECYTAEIDLRKNNTNRIDQVAMASLPAPGDRDIFLVIQRRAHPHSAVGGAVISPTVTTVLGYLYIETVAKGVALNNIQPLSRFGLPQQLTHL